MTLLTIARIIFSINLSYGFTLIPHLDPSMGSPLCLIWIPPKVHELNETWWPNNLSHGFTPIPHLDPAKSPRNSRKLISYARVIFSINLSYGFTLIWAMGWIQPKLMSFLEIHGLLAGSRWGMGYGVNPWLKLIGHIIWAKLMSFVEFYGLLAKFSWSMGVNPWLKLKILIWGWTHGSN